MKIEDSGTDDEESEEGQGKGQKRHLSLGLRRTPLVLMLAVMIAALGWLRWTMPPAADTVQAHQLRENQLASEVRSAATLYRYRVGNWPESLDLLVREGRLQASTLGTITSLGWKYSRDAKKDRFNLDTSS